MATKAIKTRTTTREVKKVTPKLSEYETHNLNTAQKFDTGVILRHKKLLGGVGIIAILLILSTILVKNFLIAAVVNGEPISRLSVITALEKQGGKTVLENMITKKLVLQEAKNKNITATKEEVDSEIKKISENLKAQKSTLEQALALQGMSKEDLNNEIKIQVIVAKMIEKDLVISEKEINDFITSNKSRMPAESTEAQLKELAISQLKQQKSQTKTQELIKNLQGKANIIHLVSY